MSEAERAREALTRKPSEAEKALDRIASNLRYYQQEVGRLHASDHYVVTDSDIAIVRAALGATAPQPGGWKWRYRKGHEPWGQWFYGGYEPVDPMEDGYCREVIPLFERIPAVPVAPSEPEGQRIEGFVWQYNGVYDFATEVDEDGPPDFLPATLIIHGATGEGNEP